MMTIELPKLIGHRGVRGYAPENTLAGFRHAASMGLTWVEFDVQLTADGTVVVIHDEDIARTTDGYGLVAQQPYSQLLEYDAGSWFTVDYTGERIPTLAEVLHCLVGLTVACNIELKACPEQAALLAKTVLQVVRHNCSPDLPPPLFSSFSIENLQALRALDQTIQLGLLLDEWRDDWQVIADELNCVTVHLGKQLVTEERIQRIQSSGRKVLSYTVNDAATAQQFFHWGIDAVFTDYPDRLAV